MNTCVPIKDLRNTAAFDELVENSPCPITVTKNGYDRFVCMRSEEYLRLKKEEARAQLLERIFMAEQERAAGLGDDAFEFTAALREKYGLQNHYSS